LKEPEQENIMDKNNPTKGRRMKRDLEKAIHQELVGQIQQIPTEMDFPTQLYLNT
jgi:hypothetical protein